MRPVENTTHYVIVPLHWEGCHDRDVTPECAALLTAYARVGWRLEEREDGVIKIFCDKPEHRDGYVKFWRPNETR